MDPLEIFLASDQPTIFPRRGNRSELLEDFNISQRHICLDVQCSFEFILEFDNTI